MGSAARRLAKAAGEWFDIASLMSAAEWGAQFDGVSERDDTTNTALSLSADSWDLYNLGYGIDGNLTMYQASGDTAHLDRALRYAENTISTAAVSSSFPGSTYQDGFLGWANHGHPSGDDGQEYPLFESYCWRYVTNTLLEIKNTPSLYADNAWKSRYDTILAFTEQNIWDKWHTRGTNHLYRSRTHMASHWAMIGLDLSQLTTDPARIVQTTTIYQDIDSLGMPTYAGGPSLRGQMQLMPSGAYFWNAVWSDMTTPGQDVSHGNAVISYVTHAHSIGSYWTNADMEAFTKTLGLVVWPNPGEHKEFVDGSGVGNGWYNDGFLKLCRFDAGLQKRLETNNVGRAVQLYGNGALNAKLLGRG